MSVSALVLLLYVAPVCDQAVAVDKGKRAKCSGIIIPKTWTQTLLQCRDVELPRCVADSEKVEAVAAAHLRACEEERAALARALRDADHAMEKSQRPPPAPRWYESRGLWFSVGVALGAASVGAAAR